APALAALAAAALLLAAGPAPGLRAQPTSAVVVRLTIDAADIINCFDETAGIGCGDADFYPVVTVDGGAEQVGTKINDDNHPRPSDWRFESGVIPYAAGTVVPLTVDLYDSDGLFRGDDDHADISPTDGLRQLAIAVTLGDVPCAVDLPTGVPDGYCGEALQAWGFEGGEGAEITFRVDVLNQSTDSDGDGLADDWERDGVTFNGQFVDLPAMGADPAKPDLFIHLDWMQDATHDQRLSDAAIRTVVAAFAGSGYVSPTGSTGINLHVDQGPGSTLDVGSGTTWGSLSRAQALPWQQNLGTGGGDNPYNWAQFQAIKVASFHPTGRSPIFHYAIAAFFQEPPGLDGDGMLQPQNTSSGISRNSVGAGFGDGASDFLITLGGFVGGTGTTQQQAGTLMHEFGHNLGLFHGGDENVNFKPNYPSIMNYYFQLGGLAVTTAGVLAPGVVDYSHGTLGGVNEGALDEAVGLGAAFSRFGTATRCPIAGSSPQDYNSQWTNRADQPFAWNCDGDTTDGIISWDANGSAHIDAQLRDFDDWSNLVFLGGAIGDVGDGDRDAPLESPVEPVVSRDTQPPTTTATLAGSLGQNGWYTSSVAVSLSATDAGGSGVAYTEYRLGAGDWTLYTAPVEIAAESDGNLLAFRSADHVGNLEPTRSITIKIDTTPPTLACGVAPERLWPPNHKLAAVSASVVVTDLGSGPAGFGLEAASSNEPDDGTGDGDTPDDIQGFELGAADTAGWLRAERAGTGNGRRYTLGYRAWDRAGNTSTCQVAVRVSPNG
ncbi:MAG: hypothetical protein KDH92_14050, partial [Chloroflexi bacterium]|nr:hypothetical protein [Chloroflexota bacterium]